MRSTCLRSTATPAGSRSNALVSANLTMAAAAPTILVVAAGDKELPSIPKARSRGQKPALQAAQTEPGLVPTSPSAGWRYFASAFFPLPLRNAFKIQTS